jgi:hypothetical protein
MNYQEVQRFSSLVWVWFIILPVAGFMWYSAYQHLIANQPVGTHPAPDWMLTILWIAFGIAMPLLFFWGGMRTEVRADGIHLQALPLPYCAKHFDYSKIETYEARRYRPLRDFGGWGIRFGRGGRAYTVSGNRGVQLVFENGQRLLIGSQHPEQMVEAIDHNITNNPTLGVADRKSEI